MRVDEGGVVFVVVQPRLPLRADLLFLHRGFSGERGGAEAAELQLRPVAVAVAVVDGEARGPSCGDGEDERGREEDI